jgi:hypothetical protein
MEMKMKKYILPFLLLLFTFTASAQTPNNEVQNEKCCEIIVQTIVGTTDTTEKSDLPQSLADIGNKLKSSFAFLSYRLSKTQVFRSAEGFEQKDSFNESVTGTTSEEVALRGLKQTQTNFHFDYFKFSLLLKTLKSINETAFTVKRFSIESNTPTLLGSVSLPKTDKTFEEAAFIVLTVKPTD